MKPQKIGRALGIGLRVAGRVAGERLAAQGQRPVQTPPNQQVADTGAVSGTASRAAGRNTGQASRGLARGISGFLRPFGSVGRKLWLEITGVFFLLPVLLFGPWMWRTRASWEHGPDHRTFLISTVIVVLFLYLGISSFWRAWRK